MSPVVKIPANRILYTNYLDNQLMAEITKRYGEEDALGVFARYTNRQMNELFHNAEKIKAPVVLKTSIEEYSAKPGKSAKEDCENFIIKRVNYGAEGVLSYYLTQRLHRNYGYRNSIVVYDSNGHLVIEMTSNREPWIKRTTEIRELTPKGKLCLSFEDLYNSQKYSKLPHLYHRTYGGAAYQYVKPGDSRNVYRLDNL